jgi:heme-degrading monooxygenase HmoA
MITFEYRFDVLPGKAKDYEKYLARAGKDIWLKFPGVRSVRIYKSMMGGSSPQRVVQVELDNLAALERIFANPDFKKAKDAFHGLVTNVSDSLLVEVSAKKK